MLCNPPAVSGSLVSELSTAATSLRNIPAGALVLLNTWLTPSVFNDPVALWYLTNATTDQRPIDAYVKPDIRDKLVKGEVGDARALLRSVSNISLEFTTDSRKPNVVTAAVSQFGTSGDFNVQMQNSALRLYFSISKQLLNDASNAALQPIKLANIHWLVALLAEAAGDNAAKVASQLKFDEIIGLGTFRGDDQFLLDTYSELGIAAEEKGDEDKAFEYFERFSNISNPSPKESSCHIYATLGVKYRQEGQIDKALECMEKDMQASVKLFGPDHIDTAASYNNLGLAYKGKGDLTNALDYLQRGLTIREKVYGNEEIETAQSHNNLGSTHTSLGNYDKAIEHHNKALAIKKHLLGEEDADVALSLNNIGSAYKSKGDTDNAKKYLELAYAMRTRILGANHPQTLNTKKGLDELTLGA